MANRHSRRRGATALLALTLASASVAPLPAHAAPAFNRNVSYSDFM